MAHDHSIKITEALTGPNGKVGLVIEHGSEKLVLSSKGLNTFAHDGMIPKPIEGARASHILDEVLHEIHHNGKKLPDGVKSNLAAALPHFEGKGVFPNLLSQVKSDVALISEINASSELAHIEKILVKKPELSKLLTETETSRLDGLGVKLAEIQKKAEELTARATKLEGLNREYNALLTAEKFDGKAAGSFLVKHAEHLDEITPSAEALETAAKSKYHHAEAVRAVSERVEAKTAQVESQLREWVEHQRTIKLDPDAANVSSAKDAAAKIEGELKQVLGSEYGNAVKGKLPKELVESASHHGGDIGKSLATGAAEKGGKVGGFVSKIFVRGDAVEKGLTGIRKISIGKTGAVAAGAVALAYVAGVGRNPKGKYTEQVAQQQLDGQQASVGVA